MCRCLHRTEPDGEVRDVKGPAKGQSVLALDIAQGRSNLQQLVNILKTVVHLLPGETNTFINCSSGCGWLALTAEAEGSQVNLPICLSVYQPVYLLT